MTLLQAPLIGGRVGVDPVSVHRMEDHDAAYDVWRAAGLRRRILVHFDGHLDFYWVPEQTDVLLQISTRADLDRLIEETPLWNVEGEPRRKTIHIGNFIHDAIRDGMVREFYWVVPDPFWETPESRESVAQNLRNIFQEGHQKGELIWENGLLKSVLLGCPLTVLPLRLLPHFEEPVLLDIDTDYLLTLRCDYRPPYFEAPPDRAWQSPSTFAQRLADHGLMTDCVTIAYSVNGGYTLLEYKYFGDTLAWWLINPRVAVCDEPEPGSAAAAYHRARTALAAGDFETARQCWSETIQRDASYRTSFAFPAHAYEVREEWAEALAAFDDLLKIDPDWPHAQDGRRRVLARLNESPEAHAPSSGSPTIPGGLMSQDMLTQTFERDPDMVTRQVAGEVILVPVARQVKRQAALFTLDGVAAFLWERIDGRRTGRELAVAMQDHYEVDTARAEADVRQFLRQLQEAVAIRPAGTMNE